MFTSTNLPVITLIVVATIGLVGGILLNLWGRRK